METSKLGYDELIAFRAFKADKADLSRVASILQLDEAEIARRALRAGLKILERIDLPGRREDQRNG
jgi:hypothetical protein